MLQGIISIVVLVGIYAFYIFYLQHKQNQPASPVAATGSGDPEVRAALVRELGPSWGPLYDASAGGNVGVLVGAIGAARGAWPRYARLCALGQEVPVGQAMNWAQTQNSPEMDLVVANACIGEGWRIRGHGGGGSVSRDKSQKFREWQERARERLLRVGSLDAVNPTPWASLVSVARNLALSDEEKRQFAREALSRCPDHYGAVRDLLDGFAPHWHDDENAGLALARELARSAPDHSLVAGCIIQAYVGKWHHAFHFGEGDAAFAQLLRRPDVQQEIAWSFGRAAGHSENEWSVRWLSDAAALAARAGMRDLAAQAFQRLGERGNPTAPWYYISKTAKLREGKCYEALRGWAFGTRPHPCRDVA